MATYENVVMPGTSFDFFDCGGLPLVLADCSDGRLRAMVVRNGRWTRVSISVAMDSSMVSEAEWRRRFWPQLARAGGFEAKIYDA